MIRPMTIAALSALGFLMFSSPAAALDMTLKLENGTQLILHDDGTWDLKDKTKPPITQTITTETSDSRTIIIMKDFSWQFMEKGQNLDLIDMRLDSVVTKGSAKKSTVAAANSAAIEIALQSASQQIRQSLRDKTVTLKKVYTCTKMGATDIDKKENFVQGQGWDVSVRIRFTKEMLQKVLDCAFSPDSAYAPVAK